LERHSFGEAKKHWNEIENELLEIIGLLIQKFSLLEEFKLLAINHSEALTAYGIWLALCKI
jgi:hypothetical protein